MWMEGGWVSVLVCLPPSATGTIAIAAAVELGGSSMAAAAAVEQGASATTEATTADHQECERLVGPALQPRSGCAVGSRSPSVFGVGAIALHRLCCLAVWRVAWPPRRCLARIHIYSLRPTREVDSKRRPLGAAARRPSTVAVPP